MIRFMVQKKCAALICEHDKDCIIVKIISEASNVTVFMEFSIHWWSAQRGAAWRAVNEWKLSDDWCKEWETLLKYYDQN